MPRTAGRDGGSGSRSNTEKRNASGQLVNALIFEGVSVLGSGSGVRGGDETSGGEAATEAIGSRVRPGCVNTPDHRGGLPGAVP